MTLFHAIADMLCATQQQKPVRYQSRHGDEWIDDPVFLSISPAEAAGRDVLETRDMGDYVLVTVR